MARSSTILNHPDRARIDAALADGQPIRQVAAAFGVGRMALHRYQQSRARPADLPLAAASIRPVAEKPPIPVRDKQDPFDVIGLSYPWQDGEVRTTDPIAEHLRLTQRSFGTAAVRTLVLDFVSRLTLAGMPDVAVARKLDVPLAAVSRWRAEQVLDRRSKLLFDPHDQVASELAQLDQMESACWKRVLEAGGSKAWGSAMTSLLRVKKQRLALLEAAGLSDHMRLPPPEPRDEHGAGLGKVAMLKGSLASFMVAAGIDPNASFDEAVGELPGVLDEMMGSVGTPERAEAARQILASFGTKKP